MTEPANPIPAKRRGNAFGIWWFKFLLRLGGLRTAYSFLHLVSAFYLLFDRDAVKPAQAYLRRRFPERGKLRRLLDVHRLFVSQGKHLIDRYCIVAGAIPFQVTLEGEEKLQEAAAANRGFILLTAHMGNWQVVMNQMGQLNRRVHVVMRPEDNPAVKSSLRLADGTPAILTISPEGHLGGVVEMVDAIDAGDVVCIMGDRPYGFSSISTPFLGAPARFPRGAFKLASATKCPVVILLSAKTGKTQYKVLVEDVILPAGARAGKSIEPGVARFAAVLERYVEKYPFQCFLFQDIWDAET